SHCRRIRRWKGGWLPAYARSISKARWRAPRDNRNPTAGSRRSGQPCGPAAASLSSTCAINTWSGNNRVGLTPVAPAGFLASGVPGRTGLSVQLPAQRAFPVDGRVVVATGCGAVPPGDSTVRGRRYPPAALFPDASLLAEAAAGRRSCRAYAAALGTVRAGRDGCRRPALGATPAGQGTPLVSDAMDIVAVPPLVLPYGAILQSAIAGEHAGGLRAVASDGAEGAPCDLDLCGGARAGALHALHPRNRSRRRGRSA